MKFTKAHSSIVTMLGAGILAVSLHAINPCAGTSVMTFNVDPSLLPCPASATEEQDRTPKQTTTKSAVLALKAGSSTVVVGNRFSVVEYFDPGGISVNAIDAVITYPTSVLKLISKDESVSPFAIRFHDNAAGNTTSSALNEIIQVQPNPGIDYSAPLAVLTFIAIHSGTATIAFTSSSQTLANDGFGTNILGSLEDASVLAQ